MKTYTYHTLLGIILGISIALGMQIMTPFTSAVGGGIYQTLFPKIVGSSASTAQDSQELLGVGAAGYQRSIGNTCIGQWANGVNAGGLSCAN